MSFKLLREYSLLYENRFFMVISGSSVNISSSSKLSIEYPLLNNEFLSSAKLALLSKLLNKLIELI